MSKIEWTNKTCFRCQKKLPFDCFGLDKSRYDGLNASCKNCRKAARKRTYVPKLNKKKMGPEPAEEREGDKKQARRRVNVLVRTNRLPHPNAIPCASCGHIWVEGERRHEYHHYAGYAAGNHLIIESLCTTCHHLKDKEA